MGKQAINDQGIESDDNCGCSDDDEAQLRDGYTFGVREGIVERNVLKRERLVERMDLIDDGEGCNETEYDNVV